MSTCYCMATATLINDHQFTKLSIVTDNLCSLVKKSTEQQVSRVSELFQRSGEFHLIIVEKSQLQQSTVVLLTVLDTRRPYVHKPDRIQYCLVLHNEEKSLKNRTKIHRSHLVYMLM